MTWREVLTAGVLPGAVAGLVGGLVYGITMSDLDLLPRFAGLMGEDSAVVGFIVLMASAAIVGMGFGILVWYQRPGAGETLLWGLVYGAFWWHLGPLTFQPLLQGDGLAWDVISAQAAVPFLVGHILYGAITGLALVFLQWRRHIWVETMRGSWGAVLRGALARVARRIASRCNAGGTRPITNLCGDDGQRFASCRLACNAEPGADSRCGLRTALSISYRWCWRWADPWYGLRYFVVGGQWADFVTAATRYRSQLVVGPGPSGLCYSARLPSVRCGRGPILPMAGRPAGSTIFRFHRCQ